jgi:hypothetical protein
MPYTAADATWTAAAFAHQMSDYDVELERRAAEAAWTDSYCRGVLPL